jgi:D-xylose transport system substrate-binding protein
MKSSRLVPALMVMGIALMACGSTTTTPTATATIPSGLSLTSFDTTYSAMTTLTSLTAAGHGLVGVILPDANTSGRYVASDLPDLTKAFQMAGYTSSNFKVDNAAGSDASELALAQADISSGAKVLVFDPLDSTVGAQIQALAAQHGVATISYDRATFQGTSTYYVSFDNFQVGVLIGKGFMSCITAWGVSNPKVFTLDGGEDTDPNAISFAQGYNSIIWGDKTTPEPAGKTNSAGYTLIGDKIASKWDNPTGGAIFAQQFTAHSNINATVEANDGLAGVVIQVLKSKNIAAKKVPTTGQDATLTGMENVLQGYQCGSVYKPIYLEAQDAVALATILRAGLTPPAALVNSTTAPASGPGATEPASLLTPYWVDVTNMEQTVIKDKFIDVTQLCGAVTAAVCTAAGVS